MRDTRLHRPGFTVVELLIAVAVLVVVILATARIFATAGTVASMGEANSNLQQTAAAIERVIRKDVARMTPEGFLVLQCIAVRNDINNSSVWPQAAQFGGSTVAPLLDPTQPADAMIRCDRVIFFTQGFEQTSRFVGSGYMGTQGGNQQALASRIQIGHGVQMPSLRPNNLNQRPDPGFMDFGSTFAPLLPWTFDAPPQPNLETSYWNLTAVGPAVYGTQPEARKWVLTRQAILLADDGGSKYLFNTDNSYGPNSAAALWRNSGAPAGAGDAAPYSGYAASAGLYPDPWFAVGRVDIAGSNLDDVQRVVKLAQNGLQLPWLGSPEGQWLRIRNMSVGPVVTGNGGADLAGLQGWPRAEKTAPSMGRLDEILASTVLAGNCSSIEIDWTWAEGTGRRTGSGGALQTARVPGTTNVVGLAGAQFDPRAGTVWFGLPDGVMPMAQRRGVTSLAGPQGTLAPSTNPQGVTLIGTNVFSVGTSQWAPFDNAVRLAPPIIPANIEGPVGITRPLGNAMPVWAYTAVFGFNRNNPTQKDFDGISLLRDDFTPWPRALRFTMRLHDPRLAVESGRTFQFVIDLPPQTQE